MVDELGRAPGEGPAANIGHLWLKTTKRHWRLGSKEREICWWCVKALLEDIQDTVGQSFKMSIIRYIANRENDYSCLGLVKSLLEGSTVVLKKDVFILQVMFMGKVGCCQCWHDFRGPPKGPVFLAWSVSQGSTLSTFLSLPCSRGQGSSGTSEVCAGAWGVGSVRGTRWEEAFLEHCWKSQSPRDVYHWDRASALLPMNVSWTSSMTAEFEERNTKNFVRHILLQRTSILGRFGFNPWFGKIPWRREWQPTPVFLPGESHG